MEHKTFSLMTALAGLELSESHSRELYHYSRRLFSILKPQPEQEPSGDEETADQVTRVFSEHRSILELKLEQVEPALFFGIGHLPDE